MENTGLHLKSFFYRSTHLLWGFYGIISEQMNNLITKQTKTHYLIYIYQSRQTEILVQDPLLLPMIINYHDKMWLYFDFWGVLFLSTLFFVPPSHFIVLWCLQSFENLCISLPSGHFPPWVRLSLSSDRGTTDLVELKWTPCCIQTELLWLSQSRVRGCEWQWLIRSELCRDVSKRQLWFQLGVCHRNWSTSPLALVMSSS